jgi:hypothetical protein
LPSLATVARKCVDYYTASEPDRTTNGVDTRGPRATPFRVSNPSVTTRSPPTPSRSRRGGQIHRAGPIGDATIKSNRAAFAGPKPLTRRPRGTTLWRQDFHNRANFPTAPAANNHARPVAHWSGSTREVRPGRPTPPTHLPDSQADDEFSHSLRHGARHPYPHPLCLCRGIPHRRSRSRHCGRAGC